MGQQVLYRLTDSSHHLLYVGVTSDITRRLRRHERGKSWWDQVSTIHLRRYWSRADVLEAERRAIENERPIYNLMLNYGSPNPEPFDVVPCPACSEDSYYRIDIDRYYHRNGSDNRPCWLQISRDEIPDGPATDRYGRVL